MHRMIERLCLVNAVIVQVDFKFPITRRNIKGRPFWSRVWVLASIPTERNALNG